MKREDLKNKIINHLQRKGNYDEDVDDYLIDMLLDNIEYSEQSKDTILIKGLMTKMPNGNGIETTKENPAFGTYVKCLENIHNCATKLGINRKDRIALKLLEEKDRDDFEMIMSEK